MKKLLLAAAVLLGLAAFAAAQDVKPVDIYVGGGVSIPNAPDRFKDGMKMGFHGMGGIEAKASTGFSLLFLADYNRFSPDVEGIDGGEVSVLTFTLNAKLGLGVPAAPIKPYIFGGIGLANTSASDFSGTVPDDVNVVTMESKTNACFNVGGGLQFKAGPAAAIFIQARYMIIATEGDATKYFPITVGFKF
jgi:opacity protein-like surface antigen